MNEDLIISVQKEHVDNMRSGKKRIELRKTRPRHVSFPARCLLYETKADGGAGAVVGEFNIDNIEEIDMLKLKVPAAACVDLDFALRYAAGRRMLYGWVMRDVVFYGKAIPVTRYARRAPQSWQFVKEVTQ
ncbi:MAG: hypothetical protein ACLSUU_06235 [Christensenellales bacterium]|nr:MAG TPA: hypothetical protein [Caudoviricetes sp.]